jgi:hypothetical protein
MTGITHSHPTSRQLLPRDERLVRILGVAVVAALAALLVALLLAFEGGDSPGAINARQPAVQARQAPSVQQTSEPGVRYDGGPEEGTAAITQRSAPATFDPNSIKNPPGQRYDGGPEEGTRGLGH